MQLRVFQDRREGKGPGFAVIELRGPDVPVGLAQPMFTIQRANKQVLGRNGWQAMQERLSPESVESGEELLRLYVGPDIVDHMQPETYLFSLQLVDGNRVPPMGMPWRNVAARPAEKRGSGVASVREEPDRPKTVAPIQPQRDENAGEILEREAGRPQLSPLPLPADRASPAEAPSRRRPWAIAAAAALLAIASLLLYLKPWVSGQPEGGGPVVVTEPVSPPPVAVVPPLQHARTVLASNPDAERAFTEARALEGRPEGHDGAFLLFQHAAEMNHAQAALMVARYFDPSIDFPGIPFAKDGEGALDWYLRAKNLGEGEALSGIDNLQRWAEVRAAGGDAASIRLMRRAR